MNDNHPAAACYARTDNGVLIVGNEHFERQWSLHGGLLHALSFRSKSTGREWLARPARQPAPLPPCDVPPAGLQTTLDTHRGQAWPGEADSLTVTVTGRGPTEELSWRIQVFPEATGAILQLTCPPCRTASQSGRQKGPGGAPTGLELADMQAAGEDGLVPADCLEYLEPASNHLELTQATLLDQTDVHNELVFENCWLLHPNEQSLALRGNLFALEDPLTGEGLVMVKHAPLPDIRPHRIDADLRVWGSSAIFRDYSPSAEYSPSHELYPLAYRIALYGNGVGPDGGEGCPFAMLSYTGGQTGRTAMFQRYQRLFRDASPRPRAVMISNTWGDRNGDSRLQEQVLLEEIDAAADLGVDVMQVDDGWQKGVTSNSTRAAEAGGGAWESFWDFDPDFWQPHPERLPRGLEPLVDRARQRGVELGLWFAPDSANDFANWQKDTDVILGLFRGHGIRHVKIDGVKVRTLPGQANLQRFFRSVLQETQGQVVFDLDATAETRPGYFGMMHPGPIFLENRYSDFRRYWPHQTLRNLWLLSPWVDPLRLRLEFLSPTRNSDRYLDDPLAPDRYPPETLLATTLLAGPLAWMEVRHLPQAHHRAMASLANVWKQHRDDLQAGTIHRLGQAPDGVSWTGLLSFAPSRRCAYAIVFRELSHQTASDIELPADVPASAEVQTLAGHGTAELATDRLTVRVDRPLGFVLARLAW